VSHSARHDYSSAADTGADTYDVQVDNDFAGLAEQTLAGCPPAERSV
jgi:hypothetical protein